MPEELFASPNAILAGRWRVERRLGQGGMATVYLARDLRHDRDVAIKVLRPEIATALGSDRFLQEIRIAAHLSHPHILPLFDSAAVDDRLLFVMPYVAGESLRDRLDRSGPLPVDEAVEIARQVASALDYAHGQGVVHRDIKPENILLQAGQAVVSDFGIARAIDAATVGGGRGLTETGMALGTPRYMSPEQIAGDPVEGASDVYSLGCVLFEMLTGEPPFDGPTASSILGRHTTESAPSPRDRRAEVGRELEATVLAALAKQPGDRFESAGQMAAALSGAVAAPRRPGAFRGRVMAAVAVVALGAIGSVVWRIGAGTERGASVAVLYFDNASRDSADQYLADGITEETIARLSQLQRISVPSRGMVRRFRGQATPGPTAIGSQLGVDYLVGGSLQRGETGLRVRVELVRAASGEQVWGASFDLSGGDLLAIEDSIASTVAGEVIGRLAPAERAALAVRPTDNREAYDHYLRGNFYLSRRTSAADGRLALREYQAALALEPRFPQVLGRMGLTYGIFAFWPWNYPGLSTDSLVARGLLAANQAIAIDSTSADGWLARGFLLTPAPATPDGWRAFMVSPILAPADPYCYSGVDRCRDSAAAALERVTELAPRDAEGWYQFGRVVHGPRGDSALARSLQLEPDRAVSAWLLGWRHLAGRQFQGALSLLDSAIALGRRDRSVHSLRLEARLALGDLPGALGELAVLRNLPDADSVAWVHHAAMQIAIDARGGDLTSARTAADSLVRATASNRRRSIGTIVAAGLVAAGEVDRGITLLERLGATHTYVAGHPSVLFDPARDDARFRRLESRARPLFGGRQDSSVRSRR